jgi:MinD superfamily P-loop ATPase
MKQLVVLSGKGGTGKTSLVAAFADLGAGRAVTGGQRPAVRLILVDADVDASNLELVLAPTCLERHDFTGGELAVVDHMLCDGCGACAQACRFDAIERLDSSQPPFVAVDGFACEGCAACVYVCPAGAIGMQPQLAGQWFRSQSRCGPLFHAALRPGAENSGKLVTMVRQQARLLAMDEDYPLILVDGPPGIGCPVISAAAGTDLALIVAEPSAASIHDLERAWRLVQHFGLACLVCINKADLYAPGTARIEAFCGEQRIELAGTIPFDMGVTRAMLTGVPVTSLDNTPAARAMAAVWDRVLAALGDAEGGDQTQTGHCP